MKIAVLMSSYNGEKYIHEQIDSIVNQEGNFDLSIFVRDDGSTDGTISILSTYQDDGNLTFYKGKNLGPALSFLNLLSECRGYDYYAFSDQDDYWEKDKIKRAIKVIHNDFPIVYFSNALLVDENLNDLGRNVYKHVPRTDFNTLCCAGGILGCTMVINSQLAKYIQSHRLPSQIVMHDFYICELCLAIGGKIIYDSSSTVKYRQHSTNVVGVSKGKIEAISGIIHDITHASIVSISDQAKEILQDYSEDIQDDKVKWLNNIMTYRDSIPNRIKLGFSRRTRFVSFNNGVKNRMSILFGNR